MTPFHVGMKVVCVDDAWGQPKFWEIFPKPGHVYSIRSMKLGGGSHRVKLTFEEIHNAPQDYFRNGNPVECCFDATFFRPAHENRMDELRTLLAPVPSKAKTLSPVQS